MPKASKQFPTAPVPAELQVLLQVNAQMAEHMRCFVKMLEQAPVFSEQYTRDMFIIKKLEDIDRRLANLERREGQESCARCASSESSRQPTAAITSESLPPTPAVTPGPIPLQTPAPTSRDRDHGRERSEPAAPLTSSSPISRSIKTEEEIEIDELQSEATPSPVKRQIARKSTSGRKPAVRKIAKKARQTPPRIPSPEV